MQAVIFSSLMCSLARGISLWNEQKETINTIRKKQAKSGFSDYGYLNIGSFRIN